MSETQTETRAQRKAREAAEAAAAEAAAGTGNDGTEAGTGSDGKPEPELTDEQKAELAKIESIKSAVRVDTLTEDGDVSFAKETTPIRNRKALQLAMDEVVAQAYHDWVAGDRQTLWQKMPVVTYFIDPAEEYSDGTNVLAERRKMIRKACEVVTPEDPDTGVRIRFGREFPLSEKQAEKIGRPDDAGKTVLAWAAIAKRKVTKSDS